MGFFSTNVAFYLAIAMCMAGAILAPAILMRAFTLQYIYSDISELPDSGTGMILGASVIRGKPSPALEARIEEGALLYQSGKVQSLLVTGAVDEGYDEITPMWQYLLAAQVPEGDIAVDPHGYDTYSSIYRAHHVFLKNSLIIVSQDFHLPRAVFIARMMHIEAYGVIAPRGGRLYDYLREIPASWKAVWDLITDRTPADSALLVPLITDAE